MAAAPELLFSRDAYGGRDVLEHIRKENLDLYNRLHSIDHDARFVDEVHKHFPSLPLIPNLRCGAWYTNPSIATDTPAYFKSTDGHTNNWSLNLRRANLHLLPLIVDKRGVILVDSTRAGKRMPDALSKTVPIWCSVINRAVLKRTPEAYEHRESWDTALYTPPLVVSRQEHAQIEERLDRWATDLAASSFSLPDLPLPLRPVWITPASSTFPSSDALQSDALPVICVSASRQVENGVERRGDGFAYVQGSGDDHELWGKGLTPAIFWKHHQEIIAATRDELAPLVDRLCAAGPAYTVASRTKPSSVEKVAGRISVCAIDDLLPDADSEAANEDQEGVTYVLVTQTSRPCPVSTTTRVYSMASKNTQTEYLKTVLPEATSFISASLASGQNVCIACDTGTDLGVGIAVAALQLNFDDEGRYSPSCKHTDTADNSSTIRRRLEWVIASRPQANPSRTTLKRVNEFLLSSPAFRTASA
ncbi:initiator tRNA phosphoribosyl transferase [Schizophyllum commune]